MNICQRYRCKRTDTIAYRQRITGVVVWVCPKHEHCLKVERFVKHETEVA